MIGEVKRFISNTTFIKTFCYNVSITVSVSLLSKACL